MMAPRFGAAGSRRLHPTAGAATTDTAATSAAPPKTPTQYTDVLIIGGGPAGLAAAIMFATRGCSVVVAERNSQITYSDPDRSYVYAIDGRGRQWTDRYNLTGRLAEAAVDALDVSVTRVLPTGKAITKRQVIKDQRRLVHWLPRSSFMRLLEDEASNGPMASRITLRRNTAAESVTRSIGGELAVTLQDSVTGAPSVVAPRLLLGCDGMNSVVRSTLKAWAANDAEFPATVPARTHDSGSSANGAHSSSSGGSRFDMVAAPSLSTNLRFKVLQLPPNPAMADGTVLENASFCLLAGNKAPAIGGSPLRLGLLPIRDVTQGRTANLITLPDHPVWGVTDGEEMFKVFEQAFPQAPWRQLVPPEVMAKFAASRGGQFPAPQYSNGLATALVGGSSGPGAAKSSSSSSSGAGGGGGLTGSGVVLIGDSAHCFPPDLGQGVNSALEDVIVLEQQVFEAAGGNLTAALPAFEAARLPDSAALIKLVQTGFPLQYNQYPFLRVLWNIRFLAQVLAHKLLPALISPPLFLMIQDPARSYSSVLADTQRSRRILAVLAAGLAAGLAWLAQRALQLWRAGAVAA